MPTGAPFVFHVESRLNNPPILIRIEECVFHQVRRGAIPAICSGTEHVVVSQQVAAMLREFSAADAEFRPVNIVNVTTGVVLAQHVELIPHAELQPADVFTSPSLGIHMWHYAHSELFVSVSLRGALERGLPGEFVFTEGLSSFAASQRR